MMGRCTEEEWSKSTWSRDCVRLYLDLEMEVEAS